MTLKEILFGGGSALFVLLTLLQLAPIKINPWSAIAKAFGRAINSEVLEKVGKARKRAAVRSVWHGRGKGRQLPGAHSTLWR